MGTAAGWHDGAEVVTVRFDPEQTSYERLLEQAVARQCATAGVWYVGDVQRALAEARLGARAKALDGEPRPDAEPKYYLFKSPYRALPLTELQAVRVNARIAREEAFDDLLSPRQRELAARIRARPDVGWPGLVGVEIAEAWGRMAAFLAERSKTPAPEGAESPSAGRGR